MEEGRISASLNLIGWKIRANEVVGAQKQVVLIVEFIHGTRSEPNTFAPLAMTLESAEEVAQALLAWTRKARALSTSPQTAQPTTPPPKYRKRTPRRRR